VRDILSLVSDEQIVCKALSSIQLRIIVVVIIIIAGLLARSQYPEGPATNHLGTGFS
jgi:hypothetical protein